jgi:UPF0716 protein FxsA
VLFVLLALFVVVPIVELAAILRVGAWIGFWPTLALLVLDSVLGAMLMRSQGRAAWGRFNATLAAGRPPAREVLDGVLVIFGGALLLTPGFVTDVVGIALLAPPTRALVRRVLVRRFAQRMVASAASATFARRGARPRPGSGAGFDVDGTATEVERPTPRLP